MPSPLDLLYLTAVICGCVAVIKHSRHQRKFLALNSALILLMGAAMSAALFTTGLTDDPTATDFERGLLYISIDLAMALPIMWTQRRVADTLIVILFIAAWPFYFWGDWMMEPVTTVIACVQLFLTFPLPEWGTRCLVCLDRLIRRDPTLKMVRA
jgi:energy-converting hydrogenase Eha subunit C